MRASKSATGSVKLIFVYLLLSSPVCSSSAGEPAVTYCKPAIGSWYVALSGPLSYPADFNCCRPAKYQLPNTNYHDDFETPGISPLNAKPRKHRRQRPNLRRNARGRPQIWQRLCLREENLGLRASLTRFAVVATLLLNLSAFSYKNCLRAERHPHVPQQRAGVIVRS